MLQTTTDNERTFTDRFFKRTKNQATKDHFGKNVETKTFFEQYDKDRNEWHWVDWAQPSLPEGKRLKFEGAAVQVYKIPETSRENRSFANTKKYKLYNIRLQSPLIIDALRDKLDEYGVDVNEERAKVYAPCAILFFERNYIGKLAQTHKDKATREHLQHLCKVVNDELGTVIDDSEALIAEGKITEDLLWTLFPPSSLIVSKVGEREGNSIDWGGRVARKANYRVENNVVAWEYLDFDGFEFGFIPRSTTIANFKGKMDIKELAIYPWWAASDSGNLKRRFTNRGMKRLDYQAFHQVWGTLLNDASNDAVDTFGEDPPLSMVQFSMSIRISI